MDEIWKEIPGKPKYQFQVGNNDPIEELKNQLTGLKFDAVVGNPPFNCRSSIHLKIVGLIEDHLKKDGLLSLIMPKPILDRRLSRTLKYTAWLDTCTMVEWKDVSKDDFRKVADRLVWFTVKNDGGRNMVNLSSAPPSKTFPALRVVGIDGGDTARIKGARGEWLPTPEKNIRIYSCMGADGTPKFDRFTDASSLNKLAKYRGKPVVHVNQHGGMIKFNKIAWLDETGEHGWFRHGIDSFVFDDLETAKAAVEWVNGPEGRAYIDSCLNGGWLIREQVQAIFK